MSNPALRSTHLSALFRGFIFFAALLTVIPALADSHARIVRLSFLDGDVEIDKADGRGFDTAYLNMPVTHQSKVWARDGQAEVEFENGSSIRLTPDTIVAFTNLSLDSNGAHDTAVLLQQGTAYFDIRQKEGDSFELQFGPERVSLSNSAHFRAEADKGHFELAVLKGEVSVESSAGSAVAVKKDETITFEADDPSRYYLAKGIDTENYDSWDQDRTKSHDEAVSTANTFGSNGIAYGLEDLNSYGNYFYVPGYGYLWRPASAGPGWDPFADGYWVSYPGYGYMFVSGYPWGWAPYRYGSWEFVNGYGWCWAPGSNWSSWQAFPGVRNRPPHFHPLHPPRDGGPVVVVNHGVTGPAPARSTVVDNDSFEQHHPRPGKVVSADGTVVRQGSAGTPVQSFTGNSAVQPVGSTVPSLGESIVGRTPVHANVGGNAGRFGDDGRSHAPDANPDRGMVETRSAPAAAAPAPARAPAATAAPMPRTETHTSPRMESHASAPAPMHTSAPAMHSSGGFSGGGMRSSAPSFPSGGGGHMSSGAATSGGGGHSSGGSHR